MKAGLLLTVGKFIAKLPVLLPVCARARTGAMLMLAFACLRFPQGMIGGWLSLVLVALVAGMSPAAAPPVQANDEPLPRYARLRLGTGRFRVQGDTTAVALSPDGKLTAVVDSRRLVVWDTATGTIRRTLLSFRDSKVDFLSFRDRGRKLIAAEKEAWIRVWDTSSWRLVDQCLDGDTVGWEPSFSADGRRFATVRLGETNMPGQVIVRDLADRKVVARVLVQYGDIPWGVLSSDGKRLAVGGNFPSRPEERNSPKGDQRTHLMDLATGKELFQLTAIKDVRTGCFSPDGKLLALEWSHRNPGLEVRDAITGKLYWKQPLPSFKDEGGHVEFSEDGRQVYAISDQGRLVIWDSITGKEVLRRGIIRVVSPPGIALLADGRAVAWRQQGKLLEISDLRTGKLIVPEVGHLATVTALGFTPDGKVLCSLDHQGQLIRWNTTTGRAIKVHNLRPVLTPTGYALWPGGQAFAPDASELVAPMGSAEPLVIDPVSGKTLKKRMRRKQTHSIRIGQIIISANGSRIVAFPGSLLFMGYFPPPANPAMALSWGRRSGMPQQDSAFQFGDERVQLHNEGRMLGALSGDGKRMAVATAGTIGLSTDWTMELAGWDLVTKKKVSTRKPPTERVLSLAIALDGRTVLVRGKEADLYLCDLLTGRDLGVIDRNGKEITAAPVFSPDGRTLAIATLDNNSRPAVRLIEWASRSERQRFTPRVAADILAFSHDSKTLASGHQDTTILLWDLAGRVERPWASRPTPAGRLWAALESRDAATAWQGIEELADRPDVAIPLLENRLKPAKKPEIDPAIVSKLIGRLNSDVFAERTAASRQLAQWRWAVEASLRQALATQKDLEVRRRLERLLDALDRLTAEEILHTRCIEVLERIGSVQARKILRRLAGGDPLQVLTRETRASLGRLERKGS
jgi:WD40 repeat protein